MTTSASARLAGMPDTLAAALVAASLLLALPAGAVAQAKPAPKAPEEVADEFLRGLQGLAWRATAQRIHPATLDTFRIVMEGLVEARDGDRVLNLLLGVADTAELAALSDEVVFSRVLGSLAELAPGLLHSITGRRTRILGAVHEEGEGVAHVVYKVFPDLSNTNPEIAVLTTARLEAGGWRVRDANELSVVRTAVRGIPLDGG